MRIGENAYPVADVVAALSVSIADSNRVAFMCFAAGSATSRRPSARR
jgi:hypothetical protein